MFQPEQVWAADELPTTRRMRPASLPGHGLFGNGVGGHGGLAVRQRNLPGEGLALDVVPENALPVEEDHEVGFPPVVAGQDFAEFVHLEEVQALVQVAQGDSGCGRATLRFGRLKWEQSWQR